MAEESGADTAVEIPEETNVETTGVVETPAEHSDEPEEHQDTDETDSEGKKQRRGGFQKKIDRLKRENEELRAKLENSGSDNATAEKPDRTQFSNDEEYIDKLADWKLDQKLRDRENANQAKELARSWDEKVEAAREKYSDYDEAIAEFNDVDIRKDIIQTFAKSDVGADISYYFTQHPEELDAINHPNASSVTIKRAIQRIEGIIRGAEATVKPVKNPPPPIQPLKTKGSTGNKNPADMSLSELRKWWVPVK